MGEWYDNRNLRVVLAIVVIVVGVALIATTGESIIVRWLTALISLDIAARLAIPRRSA